MPSEHITGTPMVKKKLYGEWEPYGQARQAAQFIEDNSERPFALFVSWHPPHNWADGKNGYAAPEDLMRLYDPASIRLRGNCQDTPQNRGIYQGHMAMCTSVDRAFGVIADKLEQKGLTGDTLFVFTSDHGDTLRSHGLTHNKMRPESESARVPLMIRYPGRLQPRVSDLMVGTLDLMPTLLSLLGLQPPGTCQGKDLSQAVLQKRDDAVDSIPLFLFPLDWRGVYTRRYTYAFDTNQGGPCRYRKLYFATPEGLKWNCLWDRETDRWELQNRFDAADFRKLRKQLHEQSLAWMKHFDDAGLQHADVQRAILAPEDLKLVYDESRVKMTSGRVKGRPLDLLRK
jgi:Arylsulfatase A and related enzymes